MFINTVNITLKGIDLSGKNVDDIQRILAALKPDRIFVTNVSMSVEPHLSAVDSTNFNFDQEDAQRVASQIKSLNDSVKETDFDLALRKAILEAQADCDEEDEVP